MDGPDSPWCAAWIAAKGTALGPNVDLQIIAKELIHGHLNGLDVPIINRCAKATLADPDTFTCRELQEWANDQIGISY